MSELIYFGVPLPDLLLMVSGVFYLLCAFFVWRSLKRERNELTAALFAFLLYQAAAMFFMGIGMYTMNMLYENIASLAILLGSVYMLKFPFSSFSQGIRRTVFFLSLIAVTSLYVWFLSIPDGEMALMNFSIWYDIVVNGLVVGVFMIYVGLKSIERLRKVKAVGVGAGVVVCCVVSNVAMLSGAVLVSSVFQFMAPVMIIGSLFAGRTMQRSV